ncbi:MAG TPA: UDP-N-acetylglucosamine 2-epimerase (non-hydrolyzing), partial [Candidatus Krumholzibacteria bacterium]
MNVPTWPGIPPGAPKESAPMSSSLVAAIVLGTRPEAIKLAPLVHELQDRTEASAKLISTGQHREMLRPMLELFRLKPDVDLDLQRPDQTLEHIVTSVLEGLGPRLDEIRPDVLVVQGDTTTTFAAAWVAFHRGIPVAHLEAGLRTGDPRTPFPEEMNRRLTTRLADLHFAPTARAREALLAEGVDPAAIILTGNTVVDALRWLDEERGEELQPPAGLDPEELVGRRLALVTGHRRESFGEPFRNLCAGLRRIVDEHEDLLAVYPVHLNPRVQAPVREILGGHERIRLLEPVAYPELVWMLKRAEIVLTDSGGIQEEAPSFGVPVLILRELTERMEAVDAGVATLVGTNPDLMVEEARKRLAEGKFEAKVNPFGD